MAPPIKATRCRGANCRAPIFWAATQHGNLIPIDLEPNDDGNITITDKTRRSRLGDDLPVVDVNPPDQAALFAGAARYMPHHASCPDVETFRSDTMVAKPTDHLDKIKDTLANTERPKTL